MSEVQCIRHQVEHNWFVTDCWALLPLKILPPWPLFHLKQNLQVAPEEESEHHAVVASRALTDFVMVQTVAAAAVGER